MRLISPHKVAGVLVGALAVTALTIGPASAAQGMVDGTIGAGDKSCSWTGGVTSDTAPNNLTVDRSTINSPGGNLSCSGISATLNNDPAVSFDDGAGTLTTDALDVSVTVVGVTCRYRSGVLTAQRDGGTRSYSATADVPLAEGGFLCPASQTVTATLAFR